MGLLDSMRLAWHRFDTGRRMRRHGWTAIYVGDYRSAPSWVYTVGFRSGLGQPEIIVFDVPRQGASQLCAAVHEELRTGALTLQEGIEWATASSRCIWRKVREEHQPEWLTLAFYPAQVDGGMDAYQLVLCDGDGRAPWEEGYDERLRRLQPALWEPAHAEASA
jgi:hypothetical protein